MHGFSARVFLDGSENLKNTKNSKKTGPDIQNSGQDIQNKRKFLKNINFHVFALIVDVLTCILKVWTFFKISGVVLLVSGPIQTDVRRKNMNVGGTQTSRSFTRTRLVTKTMDGLNPPNVNPINYN